MGERQFRNKVYWFTFALSILVIWVHSYNAELYLGCSLQAFAVDRAERFLGDVLGQIAVPGFFMISAYLFYRNFAWNKLWRKWNSRIRSVLVPYIVWNTIYYAGYVIASRLPYLRKVVGKGVVPLSFQAAADAVLHYTYNYVFWYLYQLILLILLTPVIYLLIKKKAVGAIYLTALLAAVGAGASLPQLNLDALLYYSAAAFCAVHFRRFVEGEWTAKRCLAGVVLLAGGAALWTFGFPDRIVPRWNILTLVLPRLAALPGLWLVVSQSALFPARPYMKNNFFLYAVHFALVRLINKTGALLLPEKAVFPLMIYAALPAVVVVLSYLSGCFLRKKAPVVWRLLNGGR